MKLLDILQGINTVDPIHNGGREVADIQIDSRKVVEDGLFVAQKGVFVDGHAFIDNAIANGATIIVLDDDKYIFGKEGVTFILVPSTIKALPIMLNNFYGHPTKSVKLIGIIGTNGKTTIATLLHNLFLGLGLKSGLLSTVENKIGDTVYPSNLTTPDPISLFKLLAKMRDEDCLYAFMEVSSHALHQGRTDGVDFAGGVFTNISHDHLDYHKTFAAYIAAKKIFFDNLDKNAFAITNIDDKNGVVMLQNCKAKHRTYAMRRLADYKVSIIESSIDGMHLKIGDTEFFTRIIGKFNAYNILAVFGVAMELGLDKFEVIQMLSSLSAPSGRFENYKNEESNITAIIDYAHTPDAIENVCSVLVDILPQKNKLISILGCGGDRDKTKRPKMALAAVKYASKAIFTSDNPRSEDPQMIIDDMKAELDAEQLNAVFSIVDREEAIKLGVHLAQDGDIIVIMGKGHEDFQDINGVKYPFEDKKVLMKYLN